MLVCMEPDLYTLSGTKTYSFKMSKHSKLKIRYRGYLFFSVKDRNFIFTSGKATSENITDGVQQMK